jgi:hypothetical protein
MMEAQFRHLTQTPSFALTIAGYLALALSMSGTKGASVVAFICLALAGAGAIIAVQGEVRDKGLEWGWIGIAKALRRPSKRFLISFTTHLPQLLTAGAMALSWGKHDDDLRVQMPHAR